MKKIQTKKDNEIFSRFEFKYIIKRSVSEATYKRRSKILQKLMVMQITKANI